MGATLCKDVVDTKLVQFSKSHLDDNRKFRSEKQPQVLPLFTKSNKLSAAERQNTRINHTKSAVIESSDSQQENEDQFREVLNCSWCSNKNGNIKMEKANDPHIINTPVAWMEDCHSISTYREESVDHMESLADAAKRQNTKCDKFPKEKIAKEVEDENQIAPHPFAINNDCDIDNEMIAEPPQLLYGNHTRRSITPIEKRNHQLCSDSLESNFGSSDEKSLPNDSICDASEFDFINLNAEIQVGIDISNKEETVVNTNYIQSFSANVMQATYHYNKKCHRIEKCGLCDYVTNGFHGRWNELDGDVTKLMETCDKLSLLLAQKESALNLIYDKNENEHKLKEKVIQLRNKKRIGISMQKISLGRRLITFKDGRNTYQIEGKKRILLIIIITICDLEHFFL